MPENRPTEPRTEAVSAPSGLSLRAAAIKGVQATLASRFVFEIGGFIATLLIARLITPADLGRASVALMVPMAATIFTYEGFASALVQRPTVSQRHWQTSMALGIGVGLGLSLLTGLIAAFAGARLFDRETAWLIAIASPTFVLAGLSATSRARMQRELMLPQLVGLETVSFCVGTAVSIVLAAFDLGAYALVIGASLAAVMETVGGWKFVRPVRPAYDAACAREIASFGSLASIAGLAYVFRRSGPFTVLAALTTPQITGLYARAFQAAAENQAKLTGILLKVSFPVMARASSLDETQRVRRRIVSTNAIAVLPLLAILSVTADDVIPLLYGPQWSGAADAVRILVLVGAAITLTSGAEAMSLARGRPGDVAVYNGVSLVVVLLAVAAAAPHGIDAVAWTCVAVYGLQALFAQYYLIKRASGMPMRTLLADAGPACSASVIVWAGGMLVYPPFATQAPAVLSVATAVVVGLGVYACVLRLISPTSARDVVRLTRQVFQRHT